MHGAFGASTVPICKEMNESNSVTSLGHGIGRTIAPSNLETFKDAVSPPEGETTTQNFLPSGQTWS